MSELHLYRVDDGETHFYAARSEADAREQHLKLWTDLDPADECEIDSIKQMPEDYSLTVAEVGPRGEPVTKTAGEWAAQGRGQVCTTAY